MVCLYFKVQIGVNGLQGVVVLVVFQLDIAVGVRQGEEEIGVFLGQALFIVINCCGFVLQDGGIVAVGVIFPCLQRIGERVFLRNFAGRIIVALKSA